MQLGLLLVLLARAASAWQSASRIVPVPGSHIAPVQARANGAVASISQLPTSAAALFVADGEAAAVAPDGLLAKLAAIQESHTFLEGVILAIVTRLIINEIRYRVEKPVMDELGNKVATTVQRELTPDTQRLSNIEWVKLPLCIVLDLAGDASEALPIIGEVTDLGFAPLEAGALKLLFQSNVIAGFGFVEEILPFTDVIPTFTIAWCLSNLWPSTPLAQRLLGTADAKRAHDL